MSPAALEQCIVDIFTNQSIENIQRIRRHGSYHKTSTIPKSITVSSKNFNTGVTMALDQIIAKNTHNGKTIGQGKLRLFYLFYLFIFSFIFRNTL